MVSEIALCISCIFDFLIVWQFRQDHPGHEYDNYNRFIDLLERMLTYSPEERIKPMNALHHPFFTSEHNWCDIGKLEGSTGKKRRPSSALTLSDGCKSPKKFRKRSSSRQPNVGSLG
jgi:serine/threonine protein kinase